MTVQVLDAPLERLLGVQTSALTDMGATKLTLADCEAKFRMPVMAAFCVTGKLPAKAVKLAVIAPAGTVTEPGTLKPALLSRRVMLLPPAGAGWFTITEQVLEAPELMLPGLHARAVISMAAGRFKFVAPWLPFSAAVMVTLWLAGSVRVSIWISPLTDTFPASVRNALPCPSRASPVGPFSPDEISVATCWLAAVHSFKALFPVSTM